MQIKFVQSRNRSILYFIFIPLFAIILFVAAQLLYIKVNGENVPVPDIPREPITLGSGEKLTYVVMGDSTAVSQGSDYKDGVAMKSAERIAERHEVTLYNTGVSGATIKEVRDDQLKTALSYKPDIILITAGANDSTHFTRGDSIKETLQDIIDEIYKANGDTKIVVTGSPAMVAASRFPIGAKQVMGLRSKQVNAAFKPVVEKENLIFAPIADETREAFLKDPSLTAADKFHPNAKGYGLWADVINKAIDEALSRID